MSSISVITGFISGLLYGLFFLLQRRRAFSFSVADGSSDRFIVLKAVLLAVARILFLTLFLAYLLRYYKINGISFIISFFCAFWLVIINTRTLLHGNS